MVAEDVIFLAKGYGWVLQSHKPEFCELNFEQDGCVLTVWYSKMTVRTVLNHPVVGKNQLFRKRVTPEMLERLLDNPRLHTNKGYRRKWGNYA